MAAFGFGATWKGKMTSAKCFPLTGEESQVYLKGIKVFFLYSKDSHIY